jgi:hypothetical protein
MRTINDRKGILCASEGIRTLNLLIRRSVTGWACVSEPGKRGPGSGMHAIPGAGRHALIDRLIDSASTVDSRRTTARARTRARGPV